jgi:hypothetical protein
MLLTTGARTIASWTITTRRCTTLHVEEVAEPQAKRVSTKIKGDNVVEECSLVVGR